MTKEVQVGDILIYEEAVGPEFAIMVSEVPEDEGYDFYGIILFVWDVVENYPEYQVGFEFGFDESKYFTKVPSGDFQKYLLKQAEKKKERVAH